MGFTLAEALLTLAILGTLVAITTPILKNALPDFNIYRVKKVNSTLKDTIDNMLNRDIQYEGKHDFSNTGKSVLGINYVKDVTTFRKVFLRHVNMAETLKCYAYGVNGEIDCHRSTDGIVWAIPDTDFVSSVNGSVVVDIGSVEGYEKRYYVPITVYPNYKMAQAKEDPQQYMIDQAMIYGVRRDGKVIFITEGYDCEGDQKTTMQCLALNEITSSRMKRR